eukprot:CAMPEP_0182520258 /NCGR_PEP_ID=MMETSP1321-20130603/45521_1 /TAXON_ID=91990 /ORGANISM="Bolidomonas sp., Strain RCC1657" /LENGTH=65 /DNA_ID=CAMNT_0024728269 /DNA_START=759 /DNA_END=955 /DNA_ORIENTATION=+
MPLAVKPAPMKPTMLVCCSLLCTLSSLSISFMANATSWHSGFNVFYYYGGGVVGGGVDPGVAAVG